MTSAQRNLTNEQPENIAKAAFFTLLSVGTLGSCAGVTPVLRRFYAGVTTVLRQFYAGFTPVLRRCYAGVTPVLRRFYAGVTLATIIMLLLHVSRLQSKTAFMKPSSRILKTSQYFFQSSYVEQS